MVPDRFEAAGLTPSFSICASISLFAQPVRSKRQRYLSADSGLADAASLAHRAGCPLPIADARDPTVLAVIAWLRL
ncbi:hypothetical protein C0Z17_12330 [Trinickia caryophylli]|nr:hypothetical protein C0Z17_12330 [Trinickia caryophylli]